MKKAFALLLALTMTLSLAACGSSPQPGSGSSNPSGGDASGSGGETVKLVFATGSSPLQTSTAAVLRMADTLAELSGGTMELECHTDGALGEEDALVDACSMGTIDMIFCAAAALEGIIPQYQLIDLPFSFATKEEAFAFLDGDVGNYLFQLTEEKMGMHGLVYLENGLRCFSNNVRPITSPADMVGLKMRCMSSQVYIDMYSALGASATVIPYGELYTAMQQGVVDGQENPLGNIYSMRFYEVQKYITVDNHVYDPDILFINSQSFSKLTSQQQAWLEQAAAQALQESRDNLGCMTQQEYIDFFRENGCEVTELTPEQHQLFAEATKDVYKNFADSIGEEGINLYLKATGRA